MAKDVFTVTQNHSQCDPVVMHFPLEQTTIRFEQGKRVVLPHVLCHHCKLNWISVHKDVISAKYRTYFFGTFSIWILPLHSFSSTFIMQRSTAPLIKEILERGVCGKP